MNKMVEWMASNHVAANLLMLLIVFTGLMSLGQAKLEVFPETDLDMVQIQVMYLGASPEEVEESVCIKIEEALEGIEEISSLKSISNEGIGIVTAEIELGEDVSEIKDKIEAAVDRITTFPDEIEEPVIRELTNRRQTLQLAVFGKTDEKSLKVLAEKIKDDLVQLPEISQVEISGVRNFEISIEVSEKKLEAFGLTFDEVTMAVRKGSLDLPGGSIDTRGGEILIRTKGLGYTGEDYQKIILRTRPNGAIVRIKDVATVIDGFEDADLVSYFDGYPAAMLLVFRVGDEDALDVAAATKKYIESMRGELPDGVFMASWMDQSKILNDRVDLLVRNGRLGLLLVLISLALFLDIRLALWVAAGMAVSFLGAFTVMAIFDVSINMISLFAFILTLGIVVDDAIVVGENIFTHQTSGSAPLIAAKQGTVRVTTPVIFAVVTTIVAFTPMLFVEGNIGKIMANIPIIVIAVLAFSLVESLLILPAHLSGVNVMKANRLIRAIDRIPEYFGRKLHEHINGPYTRILGKIIENRYLTLTGSFAVLLVSVSMITSGLLKTTFFPQLDADNMYVSITMPQGTTLDQTRKVLERIEDAGWKVRDRYDAQAEEGMPSFFKHMHSIIGDHPSVSFGPGALAGATSQGANKAEVNIELSSSEERPVPSSELVAAWRKEVGEIAGVENMIFTSNLLNPGNDVEVQLSADNFADLDNAVEDLKVVLGNYSGVLDIRDDLDEGKPEFKIDLKAGAAVLGLTLQDLARQVRQGFYGDEAFRIQRGKDEVKVMVRYPADGRSSIGDIDNMKVRTRTGGEVPFFDVADVKFGRGYSQIKRSDRRRVITVTADVDETIANANEINNELREVVLPELMTKYGSLRYSYEGAQKEQGKSMASLGRGFAIALFVMFGLLAVVFRSYVQPLVIMSAIPFGVVGAIWGHLIMGYVVSIVSMFGIVALSGIVINDSLVLVDFVNSERNRGLSMHDAIISGCKKRFRAIFLTSITTFLGLLPMILETSLQAKFLIPMAISLGVGVLFATMIILGLVPAILMILEDVKGIFARLKPGRTDQENAHEPMFREGEANAD